MQLTDLEISQEPKGGSSQKEHGKEILVGKYQQVNSMWGGGIMGRGCLVTCSEQSRIFDFSL